MRRRGTYLICDACTRAIFVKNLDGCKRGGWKRVAKYSADICPDCVARKARIEREQGIEVSWDDVILSRRVKSYEEKVTVS